MKHAVTWISLGLITASSLKSSAFAFVISTEILFVESLNLLQKLEPNHLLEIVKL